jgi:hypothetical protein
MSARGCGFPTVAFFLKLVLIWADRCESCDRRFRLPPFFGELFFRPYLYLLRDLLRQRE